MLTSWVFTEMVTFVMETQTFMIPTIQSTTVLHDDLLNPCGCTYAAAREENLTYNECM